MPYERGDHLHLKGSLGKGRMPSLGCHTQRCQLAPVWGGCQGGSQPCVVWGIWTFHPTLSVEVPLCKVCLRTVWCCKILMLLTLSTIASPSTLRRKPNFRSVPLSGKEMFTLADINHMKPHHNGPQSLIIDKTMSLTFPGCWGKWSLANGLQHGLGCQSVITCSLQPKTVLTLTWHVESPISRKCAPWLPVPSCLGPSSLTVVSDARGAVSLPCIY